MTFLRVVPAILLTAFLLAPAAVRADAAADLKLTVERTGEEPLTIGESLSLRVTLSNTGGRPRKVTPLEQSFRSLSFLVSHPASGVEFYLLRFKPSVYEMKDPDRVALEPGKTLSTVISIPMVFAGKVELTAKYQGFGDAIYPETLSSAPLEVPVLGEGQRLLATLQTSAGDVILDLEPETAPATVTNFVDLANRGFYDGTIFHRVIPGFMVQGGDPDGNGTGGPGYNVPAEFSAVRKHLKGTLSMARSRSPHSAGSQFFICLEVTPHLDGQYTGFGQVVEGQEVVDAIGKTVTGEGDKPKETQRIVKVRVACTKATRAQAEEGKKP